MLTRKEAANLLGMNDTEFALRLIWDSAFPKQIRGAFRAADIRAWLKTQRRGGPRK
jgi:predicted DNA-binding transcriptional regulator AlpA